jgi:HlyD family secretion protein
MSIFFQLFNTLSISEKKNFFYFFFLVIILFFFDFISIALFFPVIFAVIKKDYYLIVNEFFNVNYFDRESFIYFSLFILSFSFLIKNIFYIYFNSKKKIFLSKIQLDFTSRVFQTYLNRDYSYFVNKNNSTSIQEISIMPEYISVLETFINIFIESVTLIFILLLLLNTNIFALFFIILFSVIFYFIFSILTKKKLQEYGKIINENNVMIGQAYLDIFGSIKQIILDRKQDFFVNNFYQILKKNNKSIVKSSRMIELPKFLIEIFLIFFISFIILLFITSNSDLEGSLTKIIIYIALIMRALPNISRLIYNSSNINLKFDLIKRVTSSILENQQYINFKNDNLINKSKLNFNSITLKDVSFSYNGSDFSLLDININIKKNQSIGIIGSSGSGKSTLIDIIAGLLKPTQGKIFINNNIFDKATIEQWQSKIAYISQKNYVLDATIKANIAFGLNEEEIDFKRLEKAIQLSKLENLLEKLNNNLNYLVGENGKNLSGGERQRLILARAYYNNKDIYFFDEATNSLDKNTENMIFKDIIENFSGKNTLIISSHNMELLNFCDKIIEVKEKKIIEIK